MLNIYGLNDTSRYVKNATEYALGGNAKEFGPKPSTRKWKSLGDLTSKKKLKGQIKWFDGPRTRTPLSALINPPTLVTIITNV